MYNTILKSGLVAVFLVILSACGARNVASESKLNSEEKMCEYSGFDGRLGRAYTSTSFGPDCATACANAASSCSDRTITPCVYIHCHAAR